MKKCLCQFAFFILIVPMCLRGQDAAPVDPKTILDQLDKIKQKEQADSKTLKLQLVQKFAALAADPAGALAYYEESVKAVMFAGETMQGTQYLAWKNGEAARFKRPSFISSLTLHLAYLSLSMKRSAGYEIKDLLPELINYTQLVTAAETAAGSARTTTQPPPTLGQQQQRRTKKHENEGGGGGNPTPDTDQSDNGVTDAGQGLDNELMHSPITESIFVRYLQIKGYVASLGDDWEMVPGKVDGIYEKSILPEFRRTKDMRLIQYWDAKIQRSADFASNTGRNYNVDQFNAETRPQLMWKRAEDMLTIGLKNRAITEMVNIIKEYPGAPDVPNWVAEVKKLLTPESPAAASQPQSASTPAAVVVAPPPQG